MVLTWSTLRVFEFQICFRVLPRSNGLNHCYQTFVLSSTNHRSVNPRTHVQVTCFWCPRPNSPHRPMSDASSRDKIQTVYSDGRRCDRSFPRCGVSVKCPQCGPFCEKVVVVELLESVVLEQKAGCTRESRVHSNQPVLPQGFVLHSFRDHTSRRNMKDRPRTRARHSNKTCAEDRGSKSTRRQTRTSTMPPDNERQSALDVHRISAKNSEPDSPGTTLKNSALARPISALTFIARDLPVSLSVPLSSVPPPEASLSLLRGGLSSLFIFVKKTRLSPCLHKM